MVLPMPTWPIEEIRALLEPTLAHMGYSIYALDRVGGGGRTLRIAIDKNEGFISLDDCERVSNVAAPLVEHAGLIANSYTLEVTSPGAERKLRDRAEYDRFVGRKVNVRYRMGETEVALEGLLAAVEDEGVTIVGQKDEATRLAWPDLISTRLVASLK
jgi:ribosome maturation factor RimP